MRSICLSRRRRDFQFTWRTGRPSWCSGSLPRLDLLRPLPALLTAGSVTRGGKPLGRLLLHLAHGLSLYLLGLFCPPFGTVAG